MTKTIKRSISALLTVFMALSAGAMAFADSGKSLDLVKNQAAGDNSNLYEIEVYDTYAEPVTEYASRTVYVEENGQTVAKTYSFQFDFTYTSLASHGRYVNNKIYVDQHNHHTMMTLQQYINSRPADFFADFSSKTVNKLASAAYPDIDPYGLRDGNKGSDEYGVVLRVKAKSGTGEELSVVAENPMQGEVKAVNLKFLRGTKYEKYYLLSAGCQAQDSSFLTVSQGENTGIYSIPFVKGIPWTKVYAQETEYYEQTGEDQVIASYDPFNGGVSAGRMNYVSGYKMHFDFVRRGTENGQATNDIVEYRLLSDSGANITEQGLNVDYDNKENPKASNYKKSANITISDYAGSKCTLLIMIRSAAYESIENSDPDHDLYREIIPIYLTKTEEIPIQEIYFYKAEYILTTGKDNTIDLSNELKYVPDNTTDRVVYQSSNPSVATVDKKTGKVSALKAGETTITAYGKFKEAPVASCKVTVKADITGIVIDDIDPIIQGHSADVVYSVSPNGADKQMITWTLSKPSDEKYLTISGPDQFGKVTIYAPVTDDWGTLTSRTVTLVAKTTIGNIVQATKSITIQKNVNAVGINFTAVNYGEADNNPLSKSCQNIGTDEYNIYDEQKALIIAELKDAAGADSTDQLLWRLTIDDGSTYKNILLNSTAAKDYISYVYDQNTPKNRGIIVTFLKNMHNVVTLTAYAVSEGETIDNAHAVKSITFHPNTKTNTFKYSAPSGQDFSEMAQGDVWKIPFYMQPNDDTNIDGLCVRSTKQSVLKVDVDKEHQQLVITAVGPGTATIYAYATYDEELTKNSDYTYYTKAFVQECKVKKNIEDVTVSEISSKVFKNANYTYIDIASELEVKYNNTKLAYNVDYSVELTNNKDAGKCNVIIKAIKGNDTSYAGTKTVTFDILPYDLSTGGSAVNLSVNNPTGYTYTGKGVNAEVTLKVTFASQIGLNKNDYTLSYMQNIDAGSSAVVFVTGKGNYTGTISSNFTINPRAISDGSVVIIDNLYPDSNGKVVYTGQPYSPDITARNRNTGDYLLKGTDYTLTYSEKVKAGTCKVTIKGKGNFTGSAEKSFTIEKKDIREDDVTVDPIASLTYNGGAAITPVPVITYNGMSLVNGTDFNVSYSNNSNAGKATVTINGINNYNFSRTVNFTIDPYTLTSANTAITVNQVTYTGKALTPGLSVKSIDFNKFLGRDDNGTGDYKVSFSNNINAGKQAVVTIEGTKNYTGKVNAYFEITPAHVNEMDISAIPEEFYDGTEHSPDIVAKNRVTGAALKAGTDYYLEYENNINVGTAKVIINGLNNYQGTREMTFRIAAAKIGDCQISTVADQTFSFGEGIRPKAIVKFEGKTLVEGTDYRIDYRDNYNVGTATMTFVGLGEFGGTVEKTFKIKPFELTASNTNITVDTVNYDGTAKTPFVKVEIKSNGRTIGRNDDGNGDYKVRYSNNINAGSNATVTITGTKNFTGTITKKFTINGFNIDNVGVEGIPEQNYTGKAVTPKVKVTFRDKTLKEGTDYKLKYSDNVNSGEATITITGMGNFYGTKIVKFRIKNPAIVFNEKSVNVVAGNEIKLPYSASEKVTFTTSDKKIATVDSDGLVKGKMAGQVTITGKSASGIKATIKVQVLYKDVQNKSDFWYEPTYYLTNNGVAKGYDNQTNFKPANDCSRAQMVTFLWRLAGQPNPKAKTTSFKDVKSTDYFFKPVLWAVEKGITTGVSKTKFDPQGVCTRAQTVTFLWRMAGKPAPKAKTTKFKDVKSKDYFFKATIWASERKIVAGYSDGTFKPQGKCLRRQMVTFLYKYDKYVNGKG